MAGRHAGREDVGGIDGQTRGPRRQRKPRTPDRDYVVQPYNAADLHKLAAATAKTGVLTYSRPESVARTLATDFSGASHLLLGNVMSGVTDPDGTEQQLLGLVGVKGAELTPDGRPQQEIGAAIVRAIVPFGPNGETGFDLTIWTRPTQPMISVEGEDTTFRSYWDGTFVLDMAPGSHAAAEIGDDIMGLHVGEVVVPSNTGREIYPAISVVSQDGSLEVFQANREFDPRFAGEVGSFWAANPTVLRKELVGDWQ